MICTILQGLTARAAVLKSDIPTLKGSSKIVAPKQIRSLRAALGDQSELISAAQQQLTSLEQHLSLMEEGQRSL